LILVLAVVSTLISAAFSAMVLKQYMQRRKPFQLFWGLGLLFFALAAGSEAIAFNSDWTVTTAKGFYVFGAMLLVPFLGLGSTYITFGEKAGRIAAGIVLTFALVAVVWVLATEIDLAAFRAALEPEGKWSEVGLPVFSRIVLVALYFLGTFILVGGALYSGVKIWQSKGDKDRLIAFSLIGIGALAIATAGTLGAQLGFGQEIHTIAQAPGITIMFLGFLLAGRPSKKPAEPVEARTG